ncbi:hypothetical protein GR268_37670 [Rhizobium leguminosarum]|uniref:DNA cytosine methyltransferase n=1 Tax=Rhizobium leguminosarum TaxID=384 RepID=UPI0013F93597|nr:DNA cytosine methyltransferase [Rhizobium leguminosarum]NEJ82293.1 hypothetical protein [Rhizobium leguminosarum]NKK78026.1 hypothetical protein [Rhizobium leguminosarum bv. viciae]
MTDEEPSAEQETQATAPPAGEPNLRRYRDRASAAFYEVLDSINQVRMDRPGVSDDWIIDWLQREFEVFETEAVALAEFDAKLGAHATLLKSSKVSAAVIYAMLQSDFGTRRECLAAIDSGLRLTPPDVERIRHRHAAEARDPRVARQRRSAKIRSATLSVGSAAPYALKTNSRDLLRLLEAAATREAKMPWPVPGGPKGLMDRIRENAAVVAHFFQATFGERQSPRHRVSALAKKDIIEASFLEAWHVVSDLQRGAYSLDEIRSAFSDPVSSLFQCIAFLAEARSTVPLVRATRIDGTPPRDLLHVDLMAGIGGASLGLETAGFAPAALFEPSINARRILQDNRRVWPVIDGADVGDFLRQCDEISLPSVDLVTSGTIMMPFSPVGKERDYRRIVFEDFVRVARHFRPRALFFGVDLSMMTEANGPCRAEIEKAFDDLGYGSRWIEVKAARAGLPKMEPQFVLVAMSNPAIEKFEMPVILSPVRVSLWHAITRLGPSSLRSEHHDEDLGHWRMVLKTKLGDTLAPAFILPRGKFNLKEWEELGIDISALAEGPPTLDDLSRTFRLTRPMLASIYGFPLLWRLDAALDLERRQIDTTLSPIVAKMVGLALYPLLTGKSLNYEEALMTPLLHWPTRSELYFGPVPPPPLPRPPRIERYRPRRGTSDGS